MKNLIVVASFVANTADGEDDLRIFWIFFNLGAQTLNVNVDQSSVGCVAVAPHFAQQFFTGEYLLCLAACLDVAYADKPSCS